MFDIERHKKSIINNIETVQTQSIKLKKQYERANLGVPPRKCAHIKRQRETRALSIVRILRSEFCCRNGNLKNDANLKEPRRNSADPKP